MRDDADASSFPLGPPLSFLESVRGRGETHGKELIADLTRLFDAQLSPGTVYPSLHQLEEEDVLKMHKKVRTKEYSIDDEREVRETVERTMVQHLAFGFLLYSFLPRL